MARVLLCSLAAFLICGLALATDPKDKGKDTKGKKTHEATITKVDRKAGTITVRMKDGKERTFKLTEDIRYLDSTGRVAAVDVFTSGNDVLVVEQEGKLVEVRKHDKGKTTGKTGGKETGKTPPDKK